MLEYSQNIYETLKIMQFQKENPQNNSILTYTQNSVTLNNASYLHNVLITNNTIIFPWKIIDVKNLILEDLKPVFANKPEIFILGCKDPKSFPAKLLYDLYKQNIGAETMQIGAACRTFNLLINENRNVMLGLLFS